MDARTAGLLIIAGGVAAILIGLLVLSGGLSWFGRLPGDVRWESGSTRVYVPLTSMLIVSLALSLVFYVARRLL
jgi:hypothetical protein